MAQRYYSYKINRIIHHFNLDLHLAQHCKTERVLDARNGRRDKIDDNFDNERVFE